MDAWVRDLDEVVNAIGLDNFALLGLSQGGPVGIEYSLRHPSNLTQLILWGAFSVGWLRRGRISDEERSALFTLTREGWGRNSPAYRAIFTNLFIPDANEEQMHWFNELQRKSMSAENAIRYLTEAGGIDIADRLPLVSIPTLVIHAREDSLVQYEEGRFLAASIPRARFVTLESRNHVILKNEASWSRPFHEIREFCGIQETASAAESLVPNSAKKSKPTFRQGAQGERRKLAVVMFTDMVGYSALAQKNEPAALRMLNELGLLIRPILHEFAGKEIKTMGDAFLVEFDSALEATRCALRIQQALRGHNKAGTTLRDEKIMIRIGIHLGDVEEKRGDILGDAVNIASRLEPLAKPEGICISQQVYDQIRNRNEFSLRRLGRRHLKNIRSPQVVYEVMRSTERN